MLHGINLTQKSLPQSVMTEKLLCNYLILPRFNRTRWDLRKPGGPSQDIAGHAAEINSIDFNPFDEYLFITGSSDKTIGFWDLRNTSKSLHVFEGHTDDVLKVEWEPNNSTVFASCSNDRRIRVWDISKIGQEQKGEDAADGPPELLVMIFLNI